MTTETITILAGRADEARKRMKKFEKKAKRYGVAFSVAFGPVYKQTRKEQTDNMWYPGGVRVYEVNVLDVTIEGETPKVGEYEFLASIELTEAGHFVDTVPGVESHQIWRPSDGSSFNKRLSASPTISNWRSTAERRRASDA